MDLFIMENGGSMLKMDGEFIKIKQQDTNMLETGNKIKETDMGNKRL